MFVSGKVLCGICLELKFQRSEGATMNKLDDAMRFHELALSIRGQRQQILASNIANADTPNYKARDIDFNTALAAAMNQDASYAQMQKTHTHHLSPTGSVFGTAPSYRPVVQGSVDGNTVDMDVERNAFAENALRYEASLTMMGMQIKSILSVIQG